ncbi:MAG TPA: class I adenylate-forming enzyme family protein [Terracidiphilus sp.]|jgi:acyl-CoA synthetase (AMP-forming)/AMP-acid ligase II|nr:class I adenylate-forming enzyme family protein [Terracidiphilus sp.]
MSILERYRLARDPAVTVANLVDELVRRKGNCEVAMYESGAFYLADLHAEVCSIDAFLRQSVALRPGQAVAIYRTNSRECLHWFLAIIRAGGIAVPLNPQLSLAEVRRILADSGTEILVTDKAVFERTIGNRQALAVDVRIWIQADHERDTLDGFLRVSGTGVPAPPVTIDPAATVAVFHTSGTSGFPKGAALSSNALLGARASTVLSGIFLGPRDLALVALPWSHIMAVSIALYGLMAGIRGCFLERFDVDTALDLVERFRVTTFVGVPTMFARLVNSNPAPARLASVRVWLSASDHLPTEVRLRLRQFGALFRLPGGGRIPPVLLNGYGMVELGGLAMMGIELPFLRGSGDLGLPVPPFRIRIVDETGRAVPAGVAGECQIRRRGLAPHYWNDKGDAQGLLTGDGWLRTGDLATRNRLGLIRLVGRSKDVIKSGGYSVYVRELEEAMLGHPAVARAVAFGLPHQEKGEIPVVAVELQPGSSSQEVDLLNWCRGNLAAYKAPRRIWILDPGGLPQNDSGKFLRRVLQERFAGQMN